MTLMRIREPCALALILAIGMPLTLDSDRSATTTPHSFDTHRKSEFNCPDSQWATACCAPNVEMSCQNPEGFEGRSTGVIGHTHWLATTLDGGGIPIGTPVQITYSFAPDGASISAGYGFAGSSNLFASMNTIYGNPLAWRPIFDEVLDRFEEICGVTFVHEPNDDGALVYVFPGEWGTRGDIRFAGMSIDGNGSRLGQGAYPPIGDVVIDTGDSFFADTSSNSLRLRNLLTHEISHALGLSHACPQDGTKIMEPILNLGFDGPGHDDFRQLQRRYGDALEPNESLLDAANLGAIPIDGIASAGLFNPPQVADSSRLSIRSDADEDFFRFTISEAATVTITAQPLGRTYARDASTCGMTQMSCCAGGSSDSLNQADLGLELIDTDGVTVIVAATSQPVGAAEVVNQQVLLADGDYFVRVFATNTPAEVQLYDLTVEVFDPPVVPLRISLPNGAPELMPPGFDLAVDVQIKPGHETLILGSAQLFFRADGGAFASSPLISTNGLDYVATLPATSCGDTPEFYVSAAGSINGTKLQPPSGPAAPFSPFVGQDIVELDDDFETDQGWTVQNSPQLSDGAWQRGNPMGGGDRGDPPTDFDGSGKCFLTDPPDGNSDVDDGYTWLISPSFDLSDGDTNVSYAVWYRNDTGSNPGEDYFVVDISNDDGANWTPIQTLGPLTIAGWTQNTFLVSDFVTPSSAMRLRFEASDLINPSTVEAGVDAVRIVRRACIPPSFGDFDGDGDIDSVDYSHLVDCWGGPSATPSPPSPATQLECLSAFDVDADDDVDAFDAGGFQRFFTGP